MFDVLILDGVFDPNTAITGKINNNLINEIHYWTLSVIQQEKKVESFPIKELYILGKCYSKIN